MTDDPNRIARQHLNRAGADASRNWRPGIEDLDEIDFRGTEVWRQIGPAPLAVIGEQLFSGIGPNAGEVLDIAIDPRGVDTITLYVATRGGLWKSEDSGLTWRVLTGALPSTSISSVALDPADPNMMFVGTGSAFESGGDISRGMGLWRSNDAGETWAPVDGGPDATALGEGINRVVCPAHNAVLVGCANGLFLSLDAGQTFGANEFFNDMKPIMPGFIATLEADTAVNAPRSVVSTSGSPIVVECPNHRFQQDDTVLIVGVTANPTANGSWKVDSQDSDHFILRGSSSTGSSTAGGLVFGLRRQGQAQLVDKVSLSGASKTIVIECLKHGLITGDVVSVTGVQGVPAANGSWNVRVLDDNKFELVGSRGSGTYTFGGFIDAGDRPAPQPITTGSNAPDGIELTVTGHGFLENDVVALDGIPGIKAPANFGTVRRIDPDRFAVRGLKLTGAFPASGATVRGPATAWNLAYFSVGGRQRGKDQLDPKRGLYRMTLGTQGSVSTNNIAISDNLLAHKGGLAASAKFDYVLLAQSTNPRPRTLYAAAVDTRPDLHLVGFFRSDDAGASWTDLTTELQRRLATDKAGVNGDAVSLGVDPLDRGRVYFGLKQLWRSRDAGATWPTTPLETEGGDLHAAVSGFGLASSTGRLHQGHHRVAFLPQPFWPSAPAPIPAFFGGDGGVARSDDGGDTFVRLDEDLETALLYSVDMGRGAGKNGVTFGGLRHGGTSGKRLADPDRLWSQGVGGEGGQVAVDSFDPNIVYGFANGQFIRTTNGGESWFRSAQPAEPIVVAVTNTDPVRIETLSHPFIGDASGTPARDEVTVSGVRSSGALVTAVNGKRKIARVDDRIFSLDVNGSSLPAFDAPPRAEGDRFLRSFALTAVLGAVPIQVTTSAPHGLSDGDVVHVEDVQGVTAANNTAARPTWTVKKKSDRDLTLDNSDGTGTFHVRRTGRLRVRDQSRAVPVTHATHADPIVVTAPHHGFVTGATVAISGVRGNLKANVTNQKITVVDANSFRLDGVAGDADYGAGPTLSGTSLGRGLPGATGAERQLLSLVPNAGALSQVIFVSLRTDLFRSKDAGVTFKRVRRFDDEITAIVSPAANALWVGLAGTPAGKSPVRPGTVQFSADLGDTWSTKTANQFVGDVGARGAISGIAVDPDDPLHLAVVASGYSEIDPRRRARHIFETTTGGRDSGTTKAWTEIGGSAAAPFGNPPDLPVLAAAFARTTDGMDLLIATDGGVLRRRGEPGSSNWQRVGPNLPDVSCQSLTVDNSVTPAIVRLGTYGRSAWELAQVPGLHPVVRGSLGFGDMSGLITRTLPITLFNQGGLPLTVNSLAFNLADFKVASSVTLPKQLDPGDSLFIPVEFRPVADGLRTALLTITFDELAQPPIVLPASGVGTAVGKPRVSVHPPSLRFGFVKVGTTETLSLDLTNTGLDDLDVQDLKFAAGGSPAIVLSPPPLDVSVPFTLIDFGFQLINVDFTPTTNGPVERTLEIHSTAVPPIVTVKITGEGTTVAANVLASVLGGFGLAEEPAEVPA